VTEKIRILVIEDQEPHRRGMAALLGAFKRFEFLDALDRQAGVTEASKQQPDVILLGLPENLEDMKELIRCIKDACPFSLVIAVGEEITFEQLRYILEAGIDSYLSRQTIPGNLVSAVGFACSSGMLFFPRGCLKNTDASSTRQTADREETSSKAESVLTEREIEIFRLMTLNYSNKRIASTLFISEPTVKSHVRSILHKLGAKNRMEAVLIGITTGQTERDTQEMQKSFHAHTPLKVLS